MNLLENAGKCQKIKENVNNIENEGKYMKMTENVESCRKMQDNVRKCK